MKPKGMVAAGDRRTAEVGTAVLDAGGNAVDAAVAAVFAAFFTEPVLTGAFGGGFATLVTPEGEAEAHDFFAEVPGRGLPPALADPALDFEGVEVSFGAANQIFHVGRGAVATPLLLPGLLALQAARGRLPPERLVALVRPLAEGMPLSERVGPMIAVLEPILRHTPEASAVFVRGGRLLGTGDRIPNPALLTLLEGAARGEAPGREALLATCGPPAGRLTPEDLERAQPLRAPPLSVATSGEHEVHLAPPASAGGLLIAFGLRLFETVEPAALRDETHLADHLLAALAVTAAARARFLDEALMGRADLAEAARLMVSDEVLEEHREAFARAVREGPRFEPAPPPQLGSTTHVSVIDAEGGACAITSSNGEGCGWMVPGTGVMANNFLGEEDLHPGGFHRQAPGARLSSMMCPTVVTRGGRPVLALGSGGSNRIRSAILQVLVRRLLGGAGLAEAVGAPRLHLEGRTLYVERRGPGGALSSAVLERLVRRAPGLVVFDEPNMFFGGVHVAAGDGDGAGDPRRGGAVALAR